MSEWKAKRFWKTSSVAPTEGGYAVQLDGRPVRTPVKTLLVLPTEDLARAVAAEWDAQDGAIDPETMPLTKLANSTLDKVMPQHAGVADMLAEYGGSDLLCYRAEGPEPLVERQAAAWDPLLRWAAETQAVRLTPTAGIMHVAQPEAARSRIAELTHALDAYQLTAFHEFVTLSGSWVIGYAALFGSLPLETLWDAAHVDEDWQIEQWGPDDEAAAFRATRKAAFMTAGDFLALAKAA